MKEINKKQNIKEDIHNLLNAKLHADENNDAIGDTVDFLGRFKREILWSIGEAETKRTLTRFGYSCGHADGGKPLFHPSLLRGIGVFKITEAEHNGPPIDIEVSNSLETKIYKCFHQKKSAQPQCTILAGYLTGLISAFLNQSVFFVEEKCCAQGYSVCEFSGKSKTAWKKNKPEIFEAYEENDLNMNLQDAVNQLRITKDRYQNLFEQSSVPIFIIDPNTGTILNNNLASETITGFSKEELFKMKIFEIYRPEDYEHVTKHIKQIITNNNELEAELSILTKDKKVRYVIQSSKILSYEDKFVIQTIMRDITNVKISAQIESDLQKQLIRNERFTSIGRLAAGMAHELKNPLGAIGNSLYYIRSVLKETDLMKKDEHLEKILNTAEEEVGTSVSIIGELLEFSKEIHLMLKPTQVNDLLTKVAETIPLPDNVEINLDLDPYLPKCLLDDVRLKKVFEGMIENSVQALSKKGGRITASTRYLVGIRSSELESSKHLEIIFEDNGPGIDPDILPKIFEPLFTTKTRGTGLGLAMSHNIIEKHGGTIQVMSQKNKRTRFNINIPIKIEETDNDTQ